MRLNLKYVFAWIWVDDNIIDGTQSSTITATIDDANSDDDFDSVNDQTISVSTTDNDTAGFTIVQSGGTTGVAESGTTDTFTIVLDAQPAENVIFTITSSDTGEATVSASVEFTTANWNTAQTVTVTGVDDNIIDGTTTSTLTISVVDDVSDNDFDGVDDQTVSATTSDNDVAGFTITQTDGSTSVEETGTTDTFTIVLDAQPASDVVLTVTSSDTGEATVNSPLTFTAGNWDTPQTVTVTGVDDNIIDGTISSTITVSINDGSSDDNFDAVADQNDCRFGILESDTSRHLENRSG